MVRACRVCQGQLLCKVSLFSYHKYRERHFSILLDVKLLTKSMEREM